MAAWTITGMLVFFIVVNWADKAVLGIVAQPLKEDIGITTEQIGFIGSAFFALFAVSGLASGWLASRFSPKWSLTLLALLWSVTQLPMLFSATVTALFISRVALGAAEGPAGALSQSAAFEWFPKHKRGMPASWISAGASIAKIGIAPVLTWIVIAFGWRAAFISLAIFGVVWSALWLMISRPGPYAPKKDAPAATAETGTADAVLSQRIPYKKIMLTPTFLGGLVGAFTMYGLVTVVLTWLPSYFEEGLGFSRGQAGAMFGLPSISAMIMMIGVNGLADRMLTRGASSRVARGMVGAGALLVGGALLATLPYVPGQWGPVIVVVMGYGIGCIATPLLAATISSISPPKQTAGVLGIFLALQNCGGLVAPALTGVLVGAAATPAEGYAFAFQVFGRMAVAGGIILALTVNPARDAERIGLRG
ncbi:MAG: MFS transporter [Streptosporangiales bacterium]|nr:MFS transporter [Streptosporangiales bacterium]